MQGGIIINNPNANGFQNFRRPDKNNGDLVNEAIRFSEVLVIGPNGESLGRMSRYNALHAAEQYSMDLLCVAPQANPPVCKIMDYGRYRFEQQKKQKEAKKNQNVIVTKEVQLTPQIGTHDLDTKVKHAIRFLQEGNKVKVALRFRGRQLSHVEVGEEVMNKFISLVEEYAIIEKKPALDGKLLLAVLASKVKK